MLDMNYYSQRSNRQILIKIGMMLTKGEFMEVVKGDIQSLVEELMSRELPNKEAKQ